jgi:tetratricopeptide (TPR) repeat protein
LVIFPENNPFLNGILQVQLPGQIRNAETAMRAITFLLAGLFLFEAIPARAGLYNTSEPEEEKRSSPNIAPRDSFEKVFRTTLKHLSTIAKPQVEADNPLRKRYLLAAELATRYNPDALTSEQKINLSAVFIRRRKYDDAINLLTPLTRHEPKNFLALGNLATAYQLAGQESRAISTLEQALDVWPKQMGELDVAMRAFLQSCGWHEGAYDLYRKAESYQLKLLKLRVRESLNKKGSNNSFETVDALFDDGQKPPHPVQFVGESGKFEPGRLAAAEKAKLPKDAIDIVQQLLIWMPDDVRLYWLLGELYNAQGGAKNIQNAQIILDELAGFGGQQVRAALLAEHRKELLNYDPAEPDSNPFAFEQQVAAEEKKNKDEGKGIAWQSLGIGFGTGLVVAIFGMLQFREIRRRRQR